MRRANSARAPVAKSRPSLALQGRHFEARLLKRPRKPVPRTSRAIRDICFADDNAVDTTLAIGTAKAYREGIPTSHPKWPLSRYTAEHGLQWHQVGGILQGGWRAPCKFKSRSRKPFLAATHPRPSLSVGYNKKGGPRRGNSRRIPAVEYSLILGSLFRGVFRPDCSRVSGRDL